MLVERSSSQPVEVRFVLLAVVPATELIGSPFCDLRDYRSLLPLGCVDAARTAAAPQTVRNAPVVQLDKFLNACCDGATQSLWLILRLLER